MTNRHNLSRSFGQPSLPTWKRYLYRVIYAREFLITAALLIIVVSGITGLTHIGVQVLSSVRAYVNGEALYSKSQKDAAYYLHLYGTSGRQEYFLKYEAAIAVPLGLAQVRTELDRPEPNLRRIRAGLLQARIDPADMPESVWELKLLHNLQPMASAFRFWAESDQLVVELDAIAHLLRDKMRAGQGGDAATVLLLQEIERLNLNLTNLEDAFSRTLGEAARWVRQVILWSVLLGALLLLAIALVPLGNMLHRLKSSEEKFRRLFEQSSDAIVFVTLDGTLAYANPAATHLFGYPPDDYNQVAEEALRADLHFATDRARRLLLRELRIHGAVQDYEIRLRKTDDSLVDCIITATLIRDDHENVIGYECIIRDITERRRTQERMRLLERAVDASGNGIFISDATHSDYPLVYVNPAFEHMTGYAAQDALGRALEFLHEEGQPIPAPLRRALQAGEACRAVLLTARKDGTSFWNELSLAPVFDGQNQLVNYVGVQTDVTETKQAEQALVQALARQKELAELQARFVTMVSHEFRTPLATILSSAELVERYRHTWESERTLKHLRRIQASVQAMTDLLENVLVVGRVEASHQFKPIRLDLDAFTQEVIDGIWLAYGHEHHLQIDLPPRPLPVHADPNLLRYVLSNLLTNAIKYSPPGSSVRFALDTDEERVIMQVSDDGIGIPEKDLPHIFDPFYRAENADIAPGTGLGLSIVRRAVELHGGTITVNCQKTGGTMFSVSIPR